MIIIYEIKVVLPIDFIPYMLENTYCYGVNKPQMYKLLDLTRHETCINNELLINHLD